MHSVPAQGLLIVQRARLRGATSWTVALLGIAAVVVLVTAWGASADDDTRVGNLPRTPSKDKMKLDPAAYYDPPTIDAKPPKVFTRSRSAPDFPNVTLIDHFGRRVKFYDDLIKDKIVVINFMFATCTGT